MQMTIFMIIVGLGVISFSTCMMGYDEGKNKGKKKEIWKICVGIYIIGLILVITGMLGFFTKSRKFEARRRLNAPIISEVQLYGYQITGKRCVKEKSSDDEPGKDKHLIDIKDALPDFGLFVRIIALKEIEVSEEIYPKLQKGKSYLP